MTIKHQIKDSALPVPPGGDIVSQLTGLMAQAQALVGAGVGLPGLQNIGSQIAGLGSAITSAGGTSDIAQAITSLGSQMSSSNMAGMSGLLSSLTGQLGNLTNMLNLTGMSQILHQHILDQVQGIIHSAFQGQHTVKLSSGGIDLTSSQKIAHTAPILPHNGLTTVSDALQVTGGITGQSFGLLSDARLKTNIADLTSVLERVMQLKLKTFDVKTVDWETGEVHASEAKPSLGLIAQELQEVFPELVNDGGEYLTIEEGKVGLVLLAAFQEFVIETRKALAELKR